MQIKKSIYMFLQRMFMFRKTLIMRSKKVEDIY